MHEACEIIAKLVDDKKINGKDAVILMHAVLNNNLKTNDWFTTPNSSWCTGITYTTMPDAYNSLSTNIVDASLNSVLATKNP